MKDTFGSILKILAQLSPVAAMGAQWLSEIEASEMDARIARLEDPLSRYGERGRDACAALYELIRRHREELSNHLDFETELHPFANELHAFEADGLLTGSHAVTGAFAAGLRLKPAFIVYLATLFDDPRKLEGLSETIGDATSDLDGRALHRTTGLPLSVVDAFLADAAKRGRGLKSQEIGSSFFMPHR
jgi:hypothetical protein